MKYLSFCFFLTTGLFAADIEREVSIDANLERVWTVLLNFENYKNWNPWLLDAWVSPNEQDEVTARVSLGNKTLTANHRITLVNKFSKFCWEDANWYSFMAGGERCRGLAAQDNGHVSFKVSFNYKGPLKSLAKFFFHKDLISGIETEIYALKTECEKS